MYFIGEEATTADTDVTQVTHNHVLYYTVMLDGKLLLIELRHYIFYFGFSSSR